MFVKPGPHPDEPGATLKVRIPHTHMLLPEGGQEVPENQFWLRRVMCGDVVVVPASAPAHEGPDA